GICAKQPIQCAQSAPLIDLLLGLVRQGEAGGGPAQAVPAEEALVHLADLLGDRHARQQRFHHRGHRTACPSASVSLTAEYALPPDASPAWCTWVMPRSASRWGVAASREVTRPGRRPSLARRIQVANTRPPGARSARRMGTSFSSTAITTASVRGCGTLVWSRISWATSAKARPMGFTLPSASNRPSVYSRSGKSARERCTSWEHHQVTPHWWVLSTACRTAAW